MAGTPLHDSLVIDLEGESLDLDVSFGFLDRNFEVFNSDTYKKETVEGYNVTIDAENLDPKTMHTLEDVINDINHLHNITLSLDGMIKKGIAKIAPTFGIGGVSIDIEIHLPA